MGKQLTFEYDGKTYTLEFNRKVVAAMERQGFNLNDIGSKPVLTIPKLFSGAFMMHHSSIKQSKIDEIYSKISNKQELLTQLAEMYNEPVASLLTEEEGQEGNLDWKVD